MTKLFINLNIRKEVKEMDKLKDILKIAGVVIATTVTVIDIVKKKK